MQINDIQNGEDSRDTMMLFGGVALMLLGAGMVLSSPAVRKYLGGLNVAGLVSGVAPEFERYMKLKSM